MINQAHKLLFIAFISLFCSLSIASTKEENLDRLLHSTGMNRQMVEFTESIKTRFMQDVEQDASVSESEVALMLDRVDKTILPSVILDEIRNSLEGQLSSDDIERLLEWYESDLGERFVEAENKVSTPEEYQQMMSSAQQLLANTDRVEVAARLDKLSNTTDTAIKIQEAGDVAFYTVIMKVLDGRPEQQLKVDEYKAMMAAMEPQTRERMQRIATLLYVYSLQEVDDDSLAKFEGFLSQSVTRRFNDAANIGFIKGYEKVLADWVAVSF